MMIFKKSNDPVEIKRIAVRVWGLRDEIEAALHRRIKECEALQIPLYVDDIKAFYSLNQNAPLVENVVQLAPPPAATEEEAAPSEAPAEPPLETAQPDNIEKADNILKEQAVLEKQKTPQELLRPFERQAPDVDKISYGFSLLSDINMQTTLIFSKEKFVTGQSVVVEFLIPNAFTQSAKIVKCLHYAMKSRIISETKPDYRLQCTFSFDQSGERNNLRNFLKSVEPTIVTPKKAAKADQDASLE